MNINHPTLRALILSLGIAAAGWFVGHGFARARMADGFVTVKGAWRERLGAADDKTAYIIAIDPRGYVRGAATVARTLWGNTRSGDGAASPDRDRASSMPGEIQNPAEETSCSRLQTP